MPLSSDETITQKVGIPSLGELESLIDLLPASGQTAEDETKQVGKWEPSKLMPRHREIMRRLLEGASYVEIAQEMGIHTQTVCILAGSTLFREELQKMELSADFNVLKRAEVLANEALDTMKHLMRSARSEAIRKSAAADLLDRAGYAKVEKKLIGVVDGEAVIRELSKRRRERLMGVNEEAE